MKFCTVESMKHLDLQFGNNDRNTVFHCLVYGLCLGTMGTMFVEHRPLIFITYSHL